MARRAVAFIVAILRATVESPLCTHPPPIMADATSPPISSATSSTPTSSRRQVRARALERETRPGRAAESRRWRHGENPHPLPAGAQRLPALRPRQVDLPELRPGADYGGACHLRFDDTNPEKEEQEYVDFHHRCGALAGLRLGASNLYFASTTSSGCTTSPRKLIEAGQAYVDSQTRTRCAPTAAR
jgi:hypothetical protein